MRIRHLIPLLLAAPLGAFTLSACDTTTSLTELRHALPESDPERVALSGMYRDFAEAELAAYDWWSSKRFADKGLRVAQGGDVQPEDPREWAIPVTQRKELLRAREQLVAALTETARKAQPQMAASALFHYDCWVENTDEGWQEDEITSCRDRFYTSLTALQAPATAEAAPGPAALPGAEAPVALAEAAPATDSTDRPSLAPAPTPEDAGSPALPEVTTSMLLYFPFDEAVLESQLLPQVEGLVASLKANPGTHLVINGHADRAGTDTYNLDLSARRADYMRNLLIENGIAATRVTYYAFGESDPAIDTPDGVALRANRRVEIFIE